MSQPEEVVARDQQKIIGKCGEAMDLILAKNMKYGSSFRASGYFGCFIDIRNVMSRLIQLSYTGFKEGKWDKATLRDKLADIRNFAVLAEICLDEDLFVGSPDADKELFEKLVEAGLKFRKERWQDE